MLEIELVGFVDEDAVHGKISALLKERFPLAAAEAVITIQQYIYHAVADLSGNEKSFVRVSSMDEKDRAIAKTINEELGVNVKWLRLDAYFEGKPIHGKH